MSLLCQACVRPVGNSEDPTGAECQRCYDNSRAIRNGTKTKDEVRLDLLFSLREDLVNMWRIIQGQALRHRWSYPVTTDSPLDCDCEMCDLARSCQ